MNPYLIVGIQRSGTTLLHKLLMQHPRVSVLTDELRAFPFFNIGIGMLTYGNETPNERLHSRSAMLRALASINRDQFTTHYGVKTCTTTIPRNAAIITSTIMQELSDHKIVIIDRSDLVAQLGSMISAQKSGIAHSWVKGADGREIQRITINPLKFIFYSLNCIEIKKILSRIKETNQVIYVNFESFTEDIFAGLRLIFEFLALENSQVSINSKKVMPKPEDYIVNYYQLKKIEQWIKNEFNSDKGIKALSFCNNLYNAFRFKKQAVKRSLGMMLHDLNVR